MCPGAGGLGLYFWGVSMVEHMVECDGEHLWTVRDVRDGSMRTIPFDVINREGTENFLVPTVGGKWMRISGARKRPPREVKCIKVNAPSALYAVDGTNDPFKDDGAVDYPLTHNTGGGKSVLQRNIVFHCIAHYKEIKMLLIDLKRVELSAYKKYTCCIAGVATTLENAVETLRFAQKLMMKRYGDMEAVGKNNFLDMKNAGPAFMIMIDEAGELLDQSGGSKALSEHTRLPLWRTGEDAPRMGTIGEAQVGDRILGEDGHWYPIGTKYEPREQPRYRVSIRNNRTGDAERFTAGRDHLWTVYLPDELDILITGDTEYEIAHATKAPIVDGYHVRVMTTGEMFALMNAVPREKRSSIRMRRSRYTDYVPENNGNNQND